MLMKRIGILFTIFFPLFILTSCSTSAGESGASPLVKTTNPPPVSAKKDVKEDETARKIKDEVLSNRHIYDAAVIKGKDEVLVAYKVRHLQRFRMKQIEKELKNSLQKKFKEEKFTVSSDYKIFLEAVRLQEKRDRENLSEKKVNRRLKEIIQLSNEQT